MTVSKEKQARMLELLRKSREAKAAREATTPEPEPEPSKELTTTSKIEIKLADSTSIAEPVIKGTLEPKESESKELAIPAMGTTTDKYGNEITYNQKQNNFVTLAVGGGNCILIGAAGTGKTTAVQGATAELIRSGKAGVLQYSGHKYLYSGTPGIVIISFTRRAVNNIRRAVSEDLKHNCITTHKLLEYQPVFYEVFDEVSGKMKKTMSFEPSRNLSNPLPPSIHTIIIEEASMQDLTLFSQLIDALPHKVQWILLGDLNQLPPVFGSAILGYKLLQWKTEELTEVYRQALESPIIRLAHRILSGKPIPVEEYPDWHYDNQLTIHPWAKKIKGEEAVRTLGKFFNKAVEAGQYSLDEDIILMPFNEACGTLELNKHIAHHRARKENETTYEILAGFEKRYFSVGDRVLYDKEDAVILEIEKNISYSGGRVQVESKTLDYWGWNPNQAKDAYGRQDASMDAEEMLDLIGSTDDRVRQSSHKITLRALDTDTVFSVSSAAEINSMIHGYAITVHKAQGSEWDKVFLCLHQSHATMLQRELLYTAVTRAKKELYVICEPNSFTKGIESQKIKGNTLAEKAEFFKGKLERAESKLLSYIHRG